MRLRFGDEHEPWQARLNNVKTSGNQGAWSTLRNEIRQYLQIDLGKERVVNKIATQGKATLDEWVTSYKLLFSSDGANWNEYQNNSAAKVNAVRDSFSCCLGHFSKFQVLKHGSGGQP